MKIKAAGCVVVNPKGEILLVHRPRYNDWSFPKGKIDGDELPPAAAVRETEEEAGVKVVLNQQLDIVSYDDKVVNYYTASLTKGDESYLKVRFPVKRASKTEIDDVKWFSIEDALKTMTYRLDKDLLESIVIKDGDNWYINDDYFDSECLLLPPCSPISKKKWHGDKKDRPLSGDGVKESVNLEQVLSAYGIEKVLLGKNRLFYRQTVEQYANKAEIDIEINKYYHDIRTIDTTKRTAVITEEGGL